MTPILIPVSELKPGLVGLSKINDRDIKHPIINHLRIERTKEGWITITKTDSRRFATVRLEQPASGEPHAFLVPFERLQGFVKSAEAKDTLMLLETPDKSVTAILNTRGEALKNTFPTLPVQDFPAIPRIKADPVPVHGEVRQAILQALECICEDPDRPSLHGVFFDVSQPQNHHVIATDGKHLYSSNSFRLPLKHSLILPKHKFLGWREFLNDGEWQMRSQEFPDPNAKRFIQLSTRRWRFITPTVEGQYPNWRAVMIDPVKIKSLITVDPAKLDNLMAKIESLPTHNPIHEPVGLELVNGKLSLLGKPQGAKEFTKTPVEYVKASGENVTVFLNRHLLLKALRFGLHEIGIVDSISPVRFSQGHKEMVIMPVRADLENHSTPSGSPTNNRREASTPSSAPRPRRQPQYAQASDFIGIKTVFRSGLGILKSLASSLKEATRTLKANEKEMKTKMKQLKNPRACT